MTQIGEDPNLGDKRLLCPLVPPFNLFQGTVGVLVCDGVNGSSHSLGDLRVPLELCSDIFVGILRADPLGKCLWDSQWFNSLQFRGRTFCRDTVELECGSRLSEGG